MRLSQRIACAKWPRALASTLGLLLLFSLVLPAQDFRAKLTVTVNDPTGLAITGANLDLTSVQTGEAVNAKTTESGAYSFLFLQPGAYNLKVSAPGFKPALREQIVLQSFQASGLEIRLEVGGTTDSVTVTSEGALLQTETASRGMNVDSSLVTNLPVANHNAMMLGQTLAGVYMRPLGAYTDPWTVTSQFMINGGLMYLNEFQVDGAPNNAQFANNTFGYNPPNESVSEVSVQANSYDAQYGRTSGGVVNISTKSGGSDFHGQAWTYLKRTGWNANSFQNKAIGAPRAPAPQTQWGLQVSGPFNFPKISPQSDRFKMFYLFSWDKYTEQLPNPLNLSYPAAEMRSGDFSKLVNGAGTPIVLYDPATGTLDSKGALVRQPFAGNQIPSGRINPISKAVTALMPNANIVTPGVRYSTQNLKFPTNVHYWDFINWLARIDMNIGTKHRVFVRPASMRFDETSNYNGITGPGKNGGNFSRVNPAVVLVDWVGMLSPSLVTNLRLNFSRYGEGWHSPDNIDYDLSKLGLSNSFISQLAQPSLFGQWNFGGYTSMGQSVNWNNTNTYSVAGSVTKFSGNHNIRAGFDVRLTHYLSYASGFPFAFTSSPDLTRRLWNDSSSESTSGDSFASFLLGTPSSGNAVYNVSPFFRSWYIAPWFQDDWKITRRLTLNFGLRWDLNIAPDEKHDRMNIGFDPTVTNPIGALVPAARLETYPNLANLKGGITFAGVDGRRRAALNDMNNIQPRFGLAYQVKPRLVFRGGYGLYYTNFQSNGMMQTLGFSSTSTLVNSLDGGMTPIANLLNNPFPNGIQKPTGSSLKALTYAGQGFTQWNPLYKMPRAHQFSAGFQYSPAKNSVIDVSYVGNRTTAYSGNINMNLPGYDFAKQCDMTVGGKLSYCNGLQPNPFNGIAPLKGTNLFSAANLTRFDLNRPFPEFVDITKAGVNLGKMWYNGLQINFTQRPTAGLVLTASYVRSRQIEQWGWMNQYLGIPQRSPYGFDHPNVFKVSGAYDLPFGRGRTFQLGGNRIADFFLGGWQFAPSMFIQNGERANLPANAIRLRNSHVQNIDWNQYQVRGWGNCVLNQDTNGNVTPMAYSTKAGCSSTDFSNYDWLVVPTLSGQQVSPSGAGDIRMKPYIDSNLALSKDIRVYEKLRLRFRMEATNVLNHFNLLTARFNTNPNDANFGTVFPASTSSLDAPPRVIQLGLKASW